MTREQRTLRLLDLIYRGGRDLSAWPTLFKALAEDLGGAAIQLTSPDRDWKNLPESYWVRLDPAMADQFYGHLERGLPWGPTDDPRLFASFRRGSDFFPDEELAETRIYQEWMEPQGLACEAPLLSAAVYPTGLRTWQMAIYRVEGARAFDSDDIAVCDSVVLHTANAERVLAAFLRARGERVALAAVLDRIRRGVFLVDGQGRLLIANLAARHILDANDGIALREGVLQLADEESGRELARLIADVVAWQGRDSFGAGGEMTISRPSGKPTYFGYVTALTEADPASTLGDDVAMLLVADPAADQSATADLLRRRCGLTTAETQLARLIAEGLSLEEISRDRGVTLNTTRSHLKHVFSKTGTRRQSELVGLVLGSLGSASD